MRNKKRRAPRKLNETPEGDVNWTFSSQSARKYPEGEYANPSRGSIGQHAASSQRRRPNAARKRGRPTSPPNTASLNSKIPGPSVHGFKPTLPLSSHIEGFFDNQTYFLGQRAAVLDHWSSLDHGRKRNICSVSREDIYSALHECDMQQRVSIVGDPSDTVAQEVVQAFLYALEVQDGKFKFPPAPSLEYIGVLIALETNLLLSRELEQIRSQALMTVALILFKHRYWWLAYLGIFYIAFWDNPPARVTRAYLLDWLRKFFIDYRRWYPFARWRNELWCVSAVAVCLASRRKWSLAQVILTAASAAWLQHTKGASGVIEEESGLANTRGYILLLQKLLLLYLAFRDSWLYFLIIAPYYFPSVVGAACTLSYYAVGWLVGRGRFLLLNKGLPKAYRDRLRKWGDGRRGLNRAVVLAAVAVLIPIYAFIWTIKWQQVWWRFFIRAVTVLAAVQMMRVEDLNILLEAIRKSKVADVVRTRWYRNLNRTEGRKPSRQND